MKTRRAKATDIPQNVKETVWERDGHRCLICGSPQAMPNAHIVSRAQGGLGVEQNIVTLCRECHHRMDNSQARKVYLARCIEYIKMHYPDWTDESVTYDKWKFLK